MTELSDVLAYIARASKDDLPHLKHAAKIRQRRLLQEAAAKLAPGTLVTIAGMSPQDWNGKQGEIVEVDAKAARLTFTEQSTAALRRSRATSITRRIPEGVERWTTYAWFPLQCLTPVDRADGGTPTP
ncbi:hypothetical protein ACWD01_33585 [Streptomyces sp. NPDC002835]